MTIAVSDFRVTNIETTLRYMGDQPITTPTLCDKEGGRETNVKVTIQPAAATRTTATLHTKRNGYKTDALLTGHCMCY